MAIIWEILSHTNKKAHQKMKQLIKSVGGEEQGFMLTMSMVFQWFVCLFTSNLNRNVSRLVMDNFILEGVSALFKASMVFF